MVLFAASLLRNTSPSTHSFHLLMEAFMILDLAPFLARSTKRSALQSTSSSTPEPSRTPLVVSLDEARRSAEESIPWPPGNGSEWIPQVMIFERVSCHSPIGSLLQSLFNSLN